MNRTAAPVLTLAKVAGSDPRTIALAVMEVIKYDWCTDPNDPKYRELQKEDPESFRLSTLPRAREMYAQAQMIIQEASTRIIKRALAFEKQGVLDLKDIGIGVKVGKFVPSFQGANYSFTQQVMVEDSRGHRFGFDLVWEFRDRVVVSARNWTSFSSDSSLGGKMTFAHVMLAFAYREHATTPAQFETLMEGWRKRK
jgi:hypothetical protein